MARHIHKLFDISIIDEESKLIQFKLNLFKNLFLELLGTLKDLFHGHGGSKNSGFTLNDTLNEFINMFGALVMFGHELSVEKEAVHVVDTRTDGEDCGENKREFLGGHALNFERVVDWGHVESGVPLSGKNP